MLRCGFGFHTNHGNVMLFPTFVAQLEDLVMLNPSIYLSDCFEVQLVKEWPCILLFICVVNASKKMVPKYRKTTQMLPNFSSISLQQ